MNLYEFLLKAFGTENVGGRKVYVKLGGGEYLVMDLTKQGLHLKRLKSLFSGDDSEINLYPSTRFRVVGVNKIPGVIRKDKTLIITSHFYER